MKLKEMQEKYYEIKEELEDRRRHRALVDVCRAFNPELDEETEVLVGEGRVRFCQYRDNLLLIKLYYVMGKDFPIVLEGEVKIRDKVSLAKVWIGDDFSFGQSKSGVRYEERKVYEVKDREKGVNALYRATFISTVPLWRPLKSRGSEANFDNNYLTILKFCVLRSIFAQLPIFP